LDRRLLNVGTDSVLVDNVNAARQAVNHLIEQGHTRIGAITGKMAVTTGRERQEGYIQALREHGIEHEPDLIKRVIPKIDHGFEASMELLNLPEPPTAIFTGNNLLTIGLLQALQERGLHVPEDMAIAGFDEIPFAPLVQPWITTVQQPNYDLGKVAAEVLLERVNNPSGPHRQVMLSGQLIIRESSVRSKMTS
jgi:DNA-binding LacI/PurR family transcriptional regulator